MIWDTTNTPNFLTCAQALQAGGFNVQVTDLALTVTRGTYQYVCAGGEVEVHLLNMVAAEEECGGYIAPDELLANAHMLSAKNDEVHQKQMVASINRVSELMRNRDVQTAIEDAGFQDQRWWDALPKFVAIAQMGALTTALEQVVALQQSK